MCIWAQSSHRASPHTWVMSITIAPSTITGFTVCKDNLRLLAASQEATLANVQAVRELSRIIGTCPWEEYEVMRRHADALKQLAKHAKLDLETHVARHRCFSVSSYDITEVR